MGVVIEVKDPVCSVDIYRSNLLKINLALGHMNRHHTSLQLHLPSTSLCQLLDSSLSIWYNCSCHCFVRNDNNITHHKKGKQLQHNNANRAVEVNEMWRVWQKELELTERLKGRLQEENSCRSHMDIGNSSRSSNKRHAREDDNATVSCLQNKRVYKSGIFKLRP